MPPRTAPVLGTNGHRSSVIKRRAVGRRSPDRRDFAGRLETTCVRTYDGEKMKTVLTFSLGFRRQTVRRRDGENGVENKNARCRAPFCKNRLSLRATTRDRLSRNRFGRRTSAAVSLVRAYGHDAVKPRLPTSSAATCRGTTADAND